MDSRLRGNDRGDVEGISEAILSILNDQEKARILRENGRKTVCTKFSFTNRLKILEGIYEEVVMMKSCIQACWLEGK